MNRTLFKNISFAVAGCLGVSSAAFADETEGYPLECYQGETTIFTSEIADIAEFDPTAHGVTLQDTMSVSEKNSTIYFYGPADILCVVVND
ncbi:MAG: hypothetical protein DHS20C05_18810 [Hyphococcus sp.]|nr:MAG: hypothetical protein DHS20C05_18810 [Marinicaulis sp.]